MLSRECLVPLAAIFKVGHHLSCVYGCNMVSGHTLSYNENRDGLVLIRDSIVLQIKHFSLVWYFRCRLYIYSESYCL